MGMRTFIISSILVFISACVHAQHIDHVLWYSEPAKEWVDALPIGNGRLGAMVYGDYNKEIIQLNEESVWAGNKVEANADAAQYIPEIQSLLLDGKIQEAADLSNKVLRSDPLRIRSYQSFGEFSVNFSTNTYSPSMISNYRRELDLQTGMATVQYEVGGVNYKREVFSSAPDNLIAIRFTADKPNSLTFRLSYSREQDATAFPLSEKEMRIEGQIADLPMINGGEVGLHMKFGGLVRGVNKGGSLVTNANSFFVQDADEVTFYFTAATDYDVTKLNYDRNIDPLERCREILDAAKRYSYEEMKSRHIADHSSIFDRVVFNMGAPSDLSTDERLKKVKDGEIDLSLVSLYFQYGRYLLMGSSRTPGVLPANLQGIWNNDMQAAWSSDFHTNINIQMNYWPADVCNLSETVGPLSNLITSLREPGRVTARKTYNSSGWTMNHLTDLFGRTAISDGVGWGTLPIAASWMVLHQWEHYLFTNNKEYLKSEAYPSMKEAAEFLLDFLVEDKNGYLVTAPSNSPENTYIMDDGSRFMLTYGATMDIQIITDLYNACIDAEKVLGLKSDFSKELKSAIAKLPPVKVGERYNTIQEWIEDYEEAEPGHRHMSHLFGLYPGKSINSSTPELFEAARRTIERRRFYNENEENRKGSNTGWSRAWLVNFYARLLDGNEAGNSFQGLLANSTLNNLFNTHPPFQIDGNFGGTAGVAEMLIQSHNDEVHILPALPDVWIKGEIRGLRARGGITVDIKWEDNKLTAATFVADQDMRVKVRYRNKTKHLRLKKGKSVVMSGM